MAHQSKSKNDVGCLQAILVLALLGAPVYWYTTSQSKRHPSPAPAPVVELTEEELAKQRAAQKKRRDEDLLSRAGFRSKDLVRSVLKNPADASFGGFLALGFESRFSENGTILSYGHVDSTNSFGAKLRLYWLVELRHGGSYFDVLYMRVDGPSGTEFVQGEPSAGVVGSPRSYIRQR